MEAVARGATVVLRDIVAGEESTSDYFAFEAKSACPIGLM